MNRKRLGIIDFNQPVLGFGGVETVGYLLKDGLIKNGYKVWTFFFNQKSSKSNTDIEFPNNFSIYNEQNLEFLIARIKHINIEILILQGGYKKDLIKLCAEAKACTGVKLIYPIHFHPLMGLKEYDDYCDKYIQQGKSPLTKIVRYIYCQLKRFIFTKEHLKRAQKDHCDSLFNNIDAFVTLNKEYTEIAKTLYNKENQNRFYTIPNPIEIDKQSHYTTKENIILFVGRLTYQKRVDRLLHIWANLYKRHKNWKMIVVGDGDYSNEYKSIAKKLSLKNLEFAGQQPSEIFFKKSSIVCMASSYEAQPMVLIEAQKYGCVPIAYNSFEAAVDIIQNRHNGFLIKPYRQGEYIKALDKLMSDDDYRKQIALNGKEYIEKFNLDIIVNKWIDLFNIL